MSNVFLVYFAVALSIIAIALGICWLILERAHKRLRDSERKVSELISRNYRRINKVNSLKAVVAHNCRLFDI